MGFVGIFRGVICFALLCIARKKNKSVFVTVHVFCLPEQLASLTWGPGHLSIVRAADTDRKLGGDVASLGLFRSHIKSKNFQDSSSHQISWHMHGALNVGKKNN